MNQIIFLSRIIWLFWFSHKCLILVISFDFLKQILGEFRSNECNLCLILPLKGRSWKLEYVLQACFLFMHYFIVTWGWGLAYHCYFFHYRHWRVLWRFSKILPVSWEQRVPYGWNSERLLQFYSVNFNKWGTDSA